MREYSTSECPICRKNAKKDDRLCETTKFVGYICDNCGDYVLPYQINELLLGSNSSIMLYYVHNYIDFIPEDDTMRECIRTTLYEINIKRAQKNAKCIWFYINTKPPGEEADGRVYVDILEQYKICEAKKKKR